MKIKRILSVLLIIACLFSCCSFSVSAVNDGGNMDFYANNTDLYCYYFNEETQLEVPVTPRTDLFTWKDKEAFRVIIPTADGPQDSTGPIRFVESFSLPQLHADHEYTLDFWYAFNTASFGSLFVVLEVLDGNQNLINSQILYTSPDNLVSDTWTECNISFKPDLSAVQSGYSCRLIFRFCQVHNGRPWAIHISNYIYFNDNDDDSGLLNGVLDWLSRIYHSVAGGTDREGVNHTGIVQGIKNGLTNLGDRFSTFISDLKQGLIDKLEGVKSSIENTINGIQQWFIDLKNSIKDFFTMLKNYLLYFQHPVTLNSDGVLVGADGQPVYTNPFANALEKVEDTVYGWLDDISNFLDGIDESRQNVSEYLENGSTFINGIFKISPIFSVCVAFAVVFLVIRKVVGR